MQHEIGRVSGISKPRHHDSYGQCGKIYRNDGGQSLCRSVKQTGCYEMDRADLLQTDKALARMEYSL
jgi:hypothetical protein